MPDPTDRPTAEPEGAEMPRTPLIFLDIDGVLNDHKPHPNGYSGIKSECIYRLNRIVAETGARLVISSAWRYLIDSETMTYKGFQAMLMAFGLAKMPELAGATLRDEQIPERGAQIDAFLDHWFELLPAAYVVFDDGSDLPPRGRETITLTESLRRHHPSRWVKTDGSVGLTDADADLAIAILKGAHPMTTPPDPPPPLPAAAPLDLEQFEGHTPGPWYDDGYRLFAPTDNEGKRSGVMLLEYKYLLDLEEADVRLIAAAPALLAEIRTLRLALAASEREVRGRIAGEIEREGNRLIAEADRIVWCERTEETTRSKGCGMRDAAGLIRAEMSPLLVPIPLQGLSIMTKARCKFRLTSITDFGSPDSKTFKFSAVYDSGVAAEDAAFSKYTPSGTLEATINNPAVIPMFVVNRTYYLDITPAD